MQDIIEFKVHIEKNNSNFFDEVFDDFVLFIEAHSQLNKYLLISYLICILEETNPENAQKESKTGFSFKYVCQK